MALDSCRTDGLEPAGKISSKAPMQDKPEHWESRAELMKNVPEKADGFIKVPVIIDKDDNE